MGLPNLQTFQEKPETLIFMCNLLVFKCWQINQKFSKTLVGAIMCGPKQILLWATSVPWAVRLGHLIYVEIHH